MDPTFWSRTLVRSARRLRRRTCICSVRLWRKIYGTVRRKTYVVYLYSTSAWERFAHHLGRHSLIFILALLALPALLAYSYFAEEMRQFLQNAMSTSDGKAAFSNLFVALGALTFGILAISFSMSIFLVQQSIERTPFSVFSYLIKDMTILAVYVAVTVSSILFFGASVTISAANAHHVVVFSYLLFLLVIWTVMQHYRRVLILISPTHHISHVLNRATRSLRLVDRRIEIMLKAGLIHVPNDSLNTQEERTRIGRAAVLFQQPQLLSGALQGVQQLGSLVQTYLRKGDYEITKYGLQSIVALLDSYIHVKRGSFMSSNPFIPSVDFSHDEFLIQTLEFFAAISRQCVPTKDQEMFLQIVDCQALASRVCMKIEYADRHTRGMSHSMLVIGYMWNTIEDGIVKAELPDVGLHGARKLQDVGRLMVANSKPENVADVADRLEKIGMYGLVMKSGVALTQASGEALATLFRDLLGYEGQHDFGFATNKILSHSKTLINSFVKMEKETLLGLEVENYLGPLISLGWQISIPHSLARTVERIQQDDTSDEVRQMLIYNLKNVTKDLWRFYRDIVEVASRKQSPVLLLVAMNIHYVTMSLSPLLRDERYPDQEQLLGDLSSLIYTYDWMYVCEEGVAPQYTLNVGDDLTQIGVMFYDYLKLEEVANVISILISIAHKVAKKQNNKWGAIHFVESACLLAMYCNMKQITEHLVRKLRDGFLEMYQTRFSQDSHNLINDIRPNRSDYGSGQLDYRFSGRLKQEIGYEKVSTFLDLLNAQLALDRGARDQD